MLKKKKKKKKPSEKEVMKLIIENLRRKMPAGISFYKPTE